MHPNAELITRFYTAFQAQDGAAMAACYHPEIHFSDPVFPDLRGERAGAMWRMLCEQAKDLEIEFSQVEADEKSGRAHWDARYSFSKTGRKVFNRIDARFDFKDGLIIRHIDDFSFHRWAGMALGLPGTLLGWTGFLQNKVRGTAARGLEKFLAS